MDFEDIIYVILLILSIFCGYFYQQITDVHTKKVSGTIIGFILVLIVSGVHVFHNLILVFLNALIILYYNKEKCHLASFIFSFTYLLFFRTTEYFGIPYPPGHTNLVQMMLTLKMVGLAFDINRNYISSKSKDAQQTIDDQIEAKTNEMDLGFIEIMHYSFNYVGVLTGPYIRYRTYKDYFNLPFYKHADWATPTINKLKYVPLYVILFLVATHYWPISYAKSDEFYNERSLWYRFWFIWPTFFIFRMRIYIGLVLSECVCTMANFGVYPAVTVPKPGHGPTKNFAQLQQIAKYDDKQLAEVEYSYETVQNIYPFQTEFLPTFRESMKYWNMCIQYWLAVNVYKRFPSKKYRALVTMFVSAFWHGIYLGHYICLCLAPLVFVIEDVLVKLILKDRTGWQLKICEKLMIVVKMFFFSYLSIAFMLLSVHWVIFYYNSIYHIGLIISIITYVIGLQLLKAKRVKKVD